MITKVATCKQQYDDKSDWYICNIYYVSSYDHHIVWIHPTWENSVGKFSGLKCETQGVQVQVLVTEICNVVDSWIFLTLLCEDAWQSSHRRFSMSDDDTQKLFSFNGNKFWENCQNNRKLREKLPYPT
jgi:hypothetical protein